MHLTRLVLLVSLTTSHSFSLLAPKGFALPACRFSRSHSGQGVRILQLSAISEGDCKVEKAWISRRALMATGATAILGLPLTSFADDKVEKVENEPLADKLYNGPTAYGFSFKYPKEWKPSKRNGNKHLYDLQVKPSDGGASIAVTIDQIKANTISDLGPLEALADKVLAEQQRVTTTAKVELVTKEESESKGMRYYTFSTQTDKTVRWIKVAATAEQLFTFTFTVPQTRLETYQGTIKQSLASFKVLPNSMDNFQVYGSGQAPDITEYLRRLPADFSRC